MEAAKKPKRAITLAGGGPAAGLHIGVLLRLDEVNSERKARGQPEIDFKVWALSCIGAWVGIVYHQADENHPQNKTKAQQTYEFFRDNVFRDDAGYSRFPINRAFGPDCLAFVEAWRSFVTDPKSYEKLVLPQHMLQAALKSFEFFADPWRWRWTREGDRNEWWLNQVLAVNPVARFLTSLMYLSNVNGLTKIYYKDSSFLDSIDFPKLQTLAPEIFHNAWNLDTKSMQLFRNKRNDERWQPISAKSVCACSALPYIEQTVKINQAEYCEGALVDTVNFKDLLEEYDKPDDRLDEVWVARIVDVEQVQAPKNIADGLANLCMLFAGEVGDSDVKLFRQHLRKRRSRRPRVIEIPLDSVRDPAPPHDPIDFRWNHGNLDRGVRIGKAALNQVLKRYQPPSSRRAARRSSVSEPSLNPA